MSTLNDMISKFNAKAQNHIDSQKLNPFSGSFTGSSQSAVKPGQDNYGRPVSGSKTELRGLNAKSRIYKEILELCEVINELASDNFELMRRESEENGEEISDDDTVIVTFGELFEVYNHISNKVVGLLIAAKKKGFVHFEKEMLFQRQDDDELIVLTKPIKEIRKIMREILAPSPDSSTSSDVEQ